MHLKFTQKQAPLPYPLFTLINNAGSLGDDTISQISADSFYNKAVQDPSSKSALIGQYKAGSPNSYEQIAQRKGFSYLNMEKPIWNQFKLIFGEKAWWKLINEPFIRALAKERKPVYLSTDPIEIRGLPSGSNLAQEFNLLKRLGYKEQGFDSILGLWKMSLP